MFHRARNRTAPGTCQEQSLFSILTGMLKTTGDRAEVRESPSKRRVIFRKRKPSERSPSLLKIELDWKRERKNFMRGGGTPHGENDILRTSSLRGAILFRLPERNKADVNPSGAMFHHRHRMIGRQNWHGWNYFSSPVDRSISSFRPKYRRAFPLLARCRSMLSSSRRMRAGCVS